MMRMSLMLSLVAVTNAKTGSGYVTSTMEQLNRKITVDNFLYNSFCLILSLIMLIEVSTYEPYQAPDGNP